MALRVMRTSASPSMALCGLALLAGLGALSAACTKETPLDLYVDGFAPDNVRFEVEDLGPVDDVAFQELRRRPDIDGSLPLPAGACGGPCRAAILSVFVHNKGPQPEAAPVVRLDAPIGKPARLPIRYGHSEITQGRIGRIRWLVSMYPEETRLTATVSSSVFIVDAPASLQKAIETAPAPPPQEGTK